MSSEQKACIDNNTQCLNSIKHSKRIRCRPYTIKNCSLKLDRHVYIPISLTSKLAEYIEKEDWGKDNFLLYKYLDYTWRLQLIDKMVKIFTHNNSKKLVFNTGLFSRSFQSCIYLVLIPNNLTKKNIPWKISDEYKCFATKKQLITRYKLKSSELPYKTNFFKNGQDMMFHKDYTFTTHDHHIYINGLQRILNDFGFKDSNNLNIQGIKQLMNISLNNSINLVSNRPDMIGKQVFIERDLLKNIKITKGFHIQLLFPLNITLNNITKTFALVIDVNHNKKIYQAVSIITKNMAYANMRLINKVNLSWLLPNKSNKLNTNIIEQKNKKKTNEFVDQSMLYILTAFPELKRFKR